MKTATSGVYYTRQDYRQEPSSGYPPGRKRREQQAYTRKMQHRMIAGLSWLSSEHGIRRLTLSESYLARRLNGRHDEPFTPKQFTESLPTNIGDFPCDGKVTYLGEKDGLHQYRYEAGPSDEAFMASLDVTYLRSLASTEDPKDLKRLRREVASLHLDRPDHLRLYEEFKYYLPDVTPTQSNPEAGGGGSGGDSLSLSELAAALPTDTSRADEADLLTKLEQVTRERDALRIKVTELTRAFETFSQGLSQVAAAERMTPELGRSLSRLFSELGSREPAQTTPGSDAAPPARPAAP